jgi:DNA mismatch repair protein MutL
MAFEESAKIVLLPSNVVDCIAAGEVLERPASCVKELLENSLDAGARLVQVDIEGGGLQSITVSDDGEGMSPQDVRMCVLRHATSKIRLAEDLFALHTLGFRGEALSSIAGVSKLTLISRRACDEVAFKCVVQAGQVVSESHVGAPYGTTVEVRDLFYQTPARLKFMKAPATEQAHVLDTCLKVMLGSRKAGLVVTSGGRRLLDLPENSPESERILAALGGRVEEVKPFSFHSEGVHVSGYTTHPSLQRADGKSMWIFVNHRYVRDRMLQRAVLDGYRSHIERGMYPFAVVYIDVLPQAVDVNVHPQKTEVRFSDGSLVFRAVSAAVTQAVKAWDVDVSEPGFAPSLFHASVSKPQWGLPMPRMAYASSSEPEKPFSEKGFWVSQEMPVPASVAPAWKPVAALSGVLWLYAQEEHFLVVDTVSLRRRQMLRTLLKTYAENKVVQQPLLIPEALPSVAAQVAWLETHAQACEVFGFAIEPVGPGRFMVCAVPEVFKQPSGVGHCFVRTLLEQGVMNPHSYSLHEVSQAYTACVLQTSWPALNTFEAQKLLEHEDVGTEEFRRGIEGEPLSALWTSQEVFDTWLCKKAPTSKLFEHLAVGLKT